MPGYGKKFRRSTLIETSLQPEYSIPNRRLVDGWIEIDFSNGNHIGLSKGSVVLFNNLAQDDEDEKKDDEE